MSSEKKEKATKEAPKNLDSFVGRPKLVQAYNSHFETDTRMPCRALKNCDGVISIDFQTRDLGPHTHRMVWHK